MRFVIGFIPGKDDWIDIDTHHYLSLKVLLREWGLESLYTEDEAKDLSKDWHFLDPWEDTSAGLYRLGTKFVTSTLSNGNRSLLEDLSKHGQLCFHQLQSSADFKAYKPHRSVYLGGVEVLGLNPGEVAMVAAHLGDLEAAKVAGLRTIYVERKAEEDWKKDEDRYINAKNWIDMWVTEEEGSFLEVARRFGIK